MKHEHGYLAYKSGNLDLLIQFKNNRNRWNEEIPYEKNKYKHHIEYLKKKLNKKID
jgi:hypothetical protein